MAIWRTTMQQTYAAPGGPGYSTLHFRHDGVEADLESDLQDAQDGFLLAFNGLLGLIPTSTSYRMTGVWQDVNGDREVTTPSAVAAGRSVGGNLAPSPIALVIGWRTESRSRSGRGRTFLSGFGSGATVDGTPSGDIMTQARAAGAAVVAYNQGLANGAWCVYSPTQGLARDITGSAVRDIWGVLRSRRE